APFGKDAATTAMVTLQGTPAEGETWTVSVGGLAYSVIAGAGEAVDSLATRLAAAITSDTSADAVKYVAAAEGAQLVIVNRDGGAFGTSFQITRVSGANIDTTTTTSAVVTIGAGL
ncbi:unnamed protein product, partial [Phaeothamnion confervicola]